MSNRVAFACRPLLDLSRGKSCANCGADDGTIVPAHSNFSDHGKGGHRKADDCFVADLCFACHSWLDQGNGKDPTGVWDGTYEDKREMFRRAMDATHLRQWKNGELAVVKRRR